MRRVQTAVAIVHRLEAARLPFEHIHAGGDHPAVDEGVEQIGGPDDGATGRVDQHNRLGESGQAFAASTRPRVSGVRLQCRLRMSASR